MNCCCFSKKRSKKNVSTEYFDSPNSRVNVLSTSELNCSKEENPTGKYR